jgi:uncharacterized membrane protein YdbT with pleckstrin-like domain
MAMVGLSAVKSAVNESTIPEPAKAAIISEVERSLAPLPDTWVYRIVVIALGVAIFIPLIGPLVTNNQQGVIGVLLPIATGALGALAGLLAPSPVTSR